MKTYLSEPHGASACAKNSATAAKAAVLQVPEERDSFSLKNTAEHSCFAPGVAGVASTPTAEVTHHPSASLHADVVSAIIPAIEVFAAHKNVAVAAHEYEALARHALRGLSRKTLRSVLLGNEHAMKNIFAEIDCTLDVQGTANLMAALIAAEGREVPDAATLLRMGEASMKAQFANDKAPTMRIWPDVTAMATAHYNRISQQAAQPPMLTMPNDAAVQCAIRKPAKSWASIVRAATPLNEGAIDE